MKCSRYEICNHKYEPLRPCKFHIYYLCEFFNEKAWLIEQDRKEKARMLEQKLTIGIDIK